jgi:hypothetical protein
MKRCHAFEEAGAFCTLTQGEWPPERKGDGHVVSVEIDHVKSGVPLTVQRSTRKWPMSCGKVDLLAHRKLNYQALEAGHLRGCFRSPFGMRESDSRRLEFDHWCLPGCNRTGGS